MKLRVLLRLVAAVALTCVPGASSAVVAFDGSGADLFSDPDASFPTGTPSVAASALVLPAAINNEILLEYPLADALSFAADDVVVATFTITLRRLSDDFDPVFLVTDGTGAVGGQVGDNPNGSARSIDGTLAGDTLVVGSDPEIFTGAGFPSIGETVDATVEVTLDGSSSDVRVSFLAGDDSATTARVIDRTAALSFLLVANSNVDAEVYQIESAALEIEVPEPSAPALLVAGAAVLALGRRGRGHASERS